jgi:hypothetical protein
MDSGRHKTNWNGLDYQGNKRKMSLEYWYMLPVSTIIATIAMASGVD